MTQAAASVIEAGGTAVEAGAAAKKALDDSGCALPSSLVTLPLPSCYLRNRNWHSTRTLADQFGDLTKGAVKGFEETVREATGNEECEAPKRTGMGIA